jgi:flagellar motor switch protein FliM
VLGVEGKAKFLAQIGQLRGNRALRIDRAVSPTERIDLGGGSGA